MLHNTSVNIDLICLNGSTTTVQKIWQLKSTLLRTKITLLKLKACTQKYKQSSMMNGKISEKGSGVFSYPNQ